MNQPYQCPCGIKTRAPFMVNGQLLCTLCTDVVAPRLVATRAARSWKEFTSTGRRVPTTPGFRARWLNHDED